MTPEIMFQHLPGRVRTALFLLTLAAPLNTLFHGQAHAGLDKEKKCLYVSSYHQGDEWSDEIEASIRSTLAGHCKIHAVDMDTNPNQSPEYIFKSANRIIKTIEDWQPDVVITLDDPAAKHLIAPHYRDDEIPFVFCGVNWTVEEYQFPYSNVTGMVEVAPVKNMLQEAFELSGEGRNAIFIGSNSVAEKKNFSRIQAIADELNIQIEATYASNFTQWKRTLKESANYDFAIIGSNADIKNWDNNEAAAAALELTTKPTVTNNKWMMPYSTFGFTKLAREQGDWAASVAIKILNGTSPSEIPLASNKKWDLWVNEAVLDKLQLRLTPSLIRKAKRLQTAAIDE